MNQPQNPLHIALTHHCPRCGKGKLYKNVLTIRNECDECQLAFTEHDVGDGPAFFTITLLGFLVVGIAGYLEIGLRMPFWQNLLLSTLLLLVLTPICLRFFKSYLIAMKYKLHWSQDN